MGALTFQAKHMAVEAFRWDGENEEAIGEWGGWEDVCIKTSYPPFLVVPGQRELAKVGDWIVRGSNGAFFSCPPDLFDRMFAHEFEANHHAVQLVRDSHGHHRIRCSCTAQPPAHRDADTWMAEHLAEHVPFLVIPQVITWR